MNFYELIALPVALKQRLNNSIKGRSVSVAVFSALNVCSVSQFLFCCIGAFHPSHFS